jgi:hypothetical protein
MKMRNISLSFAVFVLILAGCASQKASGEVNKPYEGYTLFNPQGSDTTYLIDNSGEVLHSWVSQYKTGNSVYLLENGNLLRTANIRAQFGAAGGAGRVEELTWDGEEVWSFEYSDDMVAYHHDIQPMPNGNVLLIAWERVSAEESRDAGRDPKLMPRSEEDQSIWMDHIIEVNREGEIVWEWHIADHLVQDYDSTKANYGVVADNPGKVNINYLGEVRASNDWNHVNAVDYNAELDQIMISVHNFGEFWIIDHSTTTEEAAGEAGEILYRWGNPAAYDRGETSDQILFGQHDAHWIPSDLPGAGNILIFNNGSKSRPYSSVEEISLPLKADGSYELEEAPGKEALVWHYEAPVQSDFYSDHISGAQRLPNGNTLVCSGADGHVFEVTAQGDIVWTYDNAFPVVTPRATKNSIFRAEKYSPDYIGLSQL